jgi:hypothetical protein
MTIDPDDFRTRIPYAPIHRRPQLELPNNVRVADWVLDDQPVPRSSTGICNRPAQQC